MENYPGFVEHLKGMISNKKKDLVQIDKAIGDMKTKRAIIADELHSYELTLNSILKQSGQVPSITQDIQDPSKSIDWNIVFREAKTHKERLIAIAKHNNGELKFSGAVDVLFKGRFMRSKSRDNAYVQLYNVVKKMVAKGEIEKVSKATYRLTKMPEQIINV